MVRGCRPCVCSTSSLAFLAEGKLLPGQVAVILLSLVMLVAQAGLNLSFFLPVMLFVPFCLMSNHRTAFNIYNWAPGGPGSMLMDWGVRQLYKLYRSTATCRVTGRGFSFSWPIWTIRLLGMKPESSIHISQLLSPFAFMWGVH